VPISSIFAGHVPFLSPNMKEAGSEEVGEYNQSGISQPSFTRKVVITMLHVCYTTVNT